MRSDLDMRASGGYAGDMDMRGDLMCPTKLLLLVLIKCLFNSEISEILCSLFSVFTLFYLILENM